MGKWLNASSLPLLLSLLFIRLFHFTLAETRATINKNGDEIHLNTATERQTERERESEGGRRAFFSHKTFEFL